MDFPAFVITLQRASQRQQQVQRIIETCPVQCKVAAAVDGSSLTDEQRSAIYCRKVHEPRYPFELSAGEIGCFLSHRNLWQSMVDHSIPMALIVEDDIEFQLPMFDQTLKFAAQNARPGDYIQFQVRNLFKTESELTGAIQLIDPPVVPLRTSAQLVTLDAAARLLAASQRIDRPVDTFVQMKWVTGINVRVAVPSNVIEVSANLGGSTIGAKKSRPAWDRLKREVLRPLYRGKIAIRSYRHAA